MREPHPHPPDRQRAVESYRTLAPGYDASCRYIEGIRKDAVESLRLEAGETVFDVACGTGTTLIAVAHQVGPMGHAVGIELVPDMAAIARRKIQDAGVASQTVLHECAAEDFESDRQADAMLFCYTHDVLQSPRAVANLLAHAKPGCRIAVVGWRWLPWSWGGVINLFNAWRARRYLTTYAGLGDPCHLLAPHLSGFRIEARYHLGSSYRAYGTVPLHRS
ncbi:MAG: methyltransferase domain-containing protein [Burkholderiales bacterium]|jgi:SAM-dependent methyltransferase|nr:methyltransferase domain-containing protein [Burkholderiales bacterium]